jgi:hypothetical protein
MWMNHDRTHDLTRPLKDVIKTLADDPNAVVDEPATSTG